MTQPARKPPRPSPPSAPVPLEQPVVYRGLSIQRERLAAIARELPPLFRRHHDELAVDKIKAPLAPDWKQYFDLDLLGALQIITVRDGSLLTGYIFNVIGTHRHKLTTRFCHIDMYWLDPAYRIGMLGLKMFKENEAFLRAAGVKKILVGEKCHFKNVFGRQVNVLFKRLGYVVEEVTYAKWIGD